MRSVVARENALRLGAYNLAFVQGNLFEPIAKMKPTPVFDVVTANPPYIGREASNT